MKPNLFFNIAVFSLWNHVPDCHKVRESQRRVITLRKFPILSDRYHFVSPADVSSLSVCTGDGHTAACFDFFLCPFLFCPVFILVHSVHAVLFEL